MRGALISNIQEGEDKAIQKHQGARQHAGLGMFQPEIQTGIVVLNIPQSAIDHKAEILNAGRKSDDSGAIKSERDTATAR